MTPLHDACRGLDLHAIQRHLGLGHDPNAPDDCGHSPLRILATSLGEQLDDLEEHADAQAIPDALALAEDAMSQLVAGGCDVAAVDRQGDTVLHVVAEYYPPQLVALLVALGVPLEARGEDGDTAFIRAAKTHWRGPTTTVSKIEVLARAGADINAVNDLGDNALHFAACNGDTPVIEALGALGVNVNQPDHRGQTPVYWASLSGHIDSIHRLIGYGADPNIANIDGRTPLMVAAQHGSAACTQALLDGGADPDGSGRGTRANDRSA